jgi:hypothetical protein
VKKIISFLLGIVIITLFCSFISSWFRSSCSPESKLAYKITGNLGKSLKKRYDLNFQGISEEAPEGKYKRIGLDFNCNRILSREEGRLLILKCVPEILEAFNSSPQFRQYMINYPFNGNNILVNVFIKPPRISEVLNPDIAVFSFVDNRIEYSITFPENTYVFHTEQENYEEALRIVEAQQSGN